MRHLAWILPLWLAAAVPGCRTAVEGPAEKVLAAGKEQFRAKEYGDAKRYFKGVRKYHPESVEAEESLLLMAECERHMRDGEDGFNHYKELLEDYPNSRFAVDVAVGLYRLGLDYVEGRMPGFLFFSGPSERGVTILEHMQIHFPHHDVADDALWHVARYFHGEKEFDSAADAYRRLLSEYPRREHALRTRFELGLALLQQSRGAIYDVGLLYEARAKFLDFIATAEQAGGAERYAKNIQTARDRIEGIRLLLAERKYEIGRFYERIDAPASAIHYYAACVREFGDTEHAQRSKERLADLNGSGDRSG